MAERHCTSCGNAAKYLRPETGFRCKPCRTPTWTCAECETKFTGRKRKYCGDGCANKAHNKKRKPGRRPIGGYPCESTAEFKLRRRESGRLRGRSAGRRFSAHYRTQISRAAYSGSIEEYAEHIERVRMRCGSADAWKAWLPMPVRARPNRIARPRLSSGELYKLRYHSDPAYRLRERMRRQFKKWLQGDRHSKPSFLGSLDYTWQELREHIERQFTKGMGWNNAGEWHIDHIVPKASFDPTKQDDVRACWALGNLRPLWADANVSKGNRRTHLV